MAKKNKGNNDESFLQTKRMILAEGVLVDTFIIKTMEKEELDDPETDVPMFGIVINKSANEMMSLTNIRIKFRGESQRDKVFDSIIDLLEQAEVEITKL